MMNSDNFVYWLQGYLELECPNEINKDKIEIIKEHIALVLTKVTLKPFSHFSTGDRFSISQLNEDHNNQYAPEVSYIINSSC